MSPATTLRPFDVEADADTVTGWFPDPVALARYAGPDVAWPLTADTLRTWCSDPTLAVWSALDGDGAMVGHVQLRTLAGGAGRLCRVAVAPDRRGEGFGGPMVDAVLQHARGRGMPEVELGVWADNAVALRLYRSLGFVDDGEEKPGVVRMVRPLA